MEKFANTLVKSSRVIGSRGNAKGGVRSNETGAVSDEYIFNITFAKFDDFLSGLPI